MKLNRIIEVIQTSIKDVYDEGFEDGSIKQALLEIQGRDRFLEELKTSQQEPCQCCSLNAGDNFCANCGRKL